MRLDRERWEEERRVDEVRPGREAGRCGWTGER